jgi:RNA polymerase sigma-70 factor (ECF subfamily)
VNYVDEDTPLIEACRGGDAASYQRLYAKYSGKVYGFARRFLADEQHAEDVTQEVFLRVFRKLSSFRGDARFSTWLFRVALNSCKNKRRSLERLSRFDPDRFRESRADFEGPPERLIDDRLLQERIDEALERLTEEQRSLLLLKAVNELSYRQIGDLFGQSENQVRGKLYRARKAFRAALEAISEPGAWSEAEEHAALVAALE